MSALAHLPPTTRPLGGLSKTVGAAHTWRSPRGRGLDRFPAPSASDRFATPKEMERGQGRRSRAFHP